MTGPRVVQLCIDCGAKILVQQDHGPSADVAYLCADDFNKRWKEGRFDEIPKTLNFGNSLKLTILLRPVRTGVRIYEQAQEGTLHVGAVR